MEIPPKGQTGPRARSRALGPMVELCPKAKLNTTRRTTYRRQMKHFLVNKEAARTYLAAAAWISRGKKAIIPPVQFISWIFRTAEEYKKASFKRRTRAPCKGAKHQVLQPQGILNINKWLTISRKVIIQVRSSERKRLDKQRIYWITGIIRLELTMQSRSF